MSISATFDLQHDGAFQDDPAAFLGELDALGDHLGRMGKIAARDRALARVAHDTRFVGESLHRSLLDNA